MSLSDSRSYFQKCYLDKFNMRFTCGNLPTDWQRLEVGIITGCTISVILVSAAMNLLVKSAEKLRWGSVLACGIQQVPIRAFMDDLTITAKSGPEGRWILEDLVELTDWARMDFIPAKSKSLVLRRGPWLGFALRSERTSSHGPRETEKELG